MNIQFQPKKPYSSCLTWLVCTFLLILSSFLVISNGFSSPKKDSEAVVITVDGAIGPASADYIARGIKSAENAAADLIIIQIDTPGGLDKSMRSIIKAILGSTIPIASYVAPSGSRAASAGTYILYASPIAAMAPGTNIGAATPVAMGGFPTPKAQDKEKSTPATPSDMENKVKKDAAAYLQSLAQLHGRNINWSQKAVLKSDSIPASKALELGVIDLIAKDIPTLLKKIDGRKIKVKGSSIILNTANAQISHFKPDWRSKFLSVITNPSIAYILMLIGIYGLFFEFANPGFVLPGVAGAICLLVALYALQLLPVSFVGLGLILLGITFMIVEAVVPSFGALGLGGIVAFAVGSVMLLDTNIPGYGIPWSLILSMVIVSGLFFFIVIYMAASARRKKIVSGQEALIGQIGLVLDDFSDKGWIQIDGEKWRCIATQPLNKGQEVKVIKHDGLTLYVEPFSVN